MGKCGGIIENPDLCKRLTGRQNLEYFASVYRNVDKENIDYIVNMVKMSERIDDKVKTYSLGMCQRIGIAQAPLHNPRLLVLDEPTNGLDPLGIKELRDSLKYLAKRPGSVYLFQAIYYRNGAYVRQDLYNRRRRYYR